MSLQEIYQVRRKALERFVRRLLRNNEDAADVSQEAFLRVYAAEVGGQTPVNAALLYTVARNLALSELRKRTSRATDAVGDGAEFELPGEGMGPEDLLQTRQMVRSVEAAMEHMPPRCVEAFRWRKVEQLSYAEIADQMGISVKTVERHITHAMRLCHEAVAENGQAESGRRRAR